MQAGTYTITWTAYSRTTQGGTAVSTGLTTDSGTVAGPTYTTSNGTFAKATAYTFTDTITVTKPVISIVFTDGYGPVDISNASLTKQ